MSIKILPIYFYPFSRTQNQILNKGNLFKQGIKSSLTHEESINYQLNYRLGGALKWADRTMLDYSPDIKAHTPLGEMSFELDLSLDSFSSLIINDPIIQKKTMYDIKMLVFFEDHKILQEGKINKYFYYVDSVKRKNANVFTFTLALDVFKTYYEDVLEIEGLIPERYFIPSNKVLDSLTTIEDDIILPYGNEVQSLLGTLSYWSEYKSGLTVSYGLEVWDYYYLKNKENGITIISILYSKDGYLRYEGRNKENINKITSNPAFIKSVRSCVPPNTTSFTVSDNEKQYLMANMNDIGTNIIFQVAGEFTINKNVKVRKMSSINELIEGLNLEEDAGLEGYIIIDSLHKYKEGNNKTYDNSTYLYDSNEMIISSPDTDINDYKNDNVSIVKPMVSVGFDGENKVALPLFKGNFNEYGGYNLKIKLEHSLFQTKEVIYFTNSRSELEISRVNEFVNPRLTDAYETYILNNKNSLIQKEKELNKFATRNTIVKGVSSVVIAGLGIAGALFTGGGSLAVAGGIIAGGMSSYNMIEGLGKNARARATHQAELDDKRGKIENFTPSNYNENMAINRYAPLLTSYNKENNSLDYTKAIYHDMKLKPNNYYNYDMLRMYGLKYGGFDLMKVSDMITREHYNYIEVADSTVAIQNGNIPNNLYNHVLEVLNNGMNYSSIDYILNNEIKNKEV